MKIPKKVKIGGHQITVDMSKGLRGLDGDWDGTRNRIRINKDLAQSQKEVTLFHEVFHVMNVTMSAEHKDGHALIESLAQQWYQFLKDNNFIR